MVPESGTNEIYSAWSLRDPTTTVKVLNIGIHFLLVGFEIELYSDHEFSMVLWYLDYLFGKFVHTISDAGFLLQKQNQGI